MDWHLKPLRKPEEPPFWQVQGTTNCQEIVLGRMGTYMGHFSNSIFCFFAAVDYIGHMIQERKKHDEELDKLKKDVMAFRIMKA